MIGHCWFDVIDRDDAIVRTIRPWEDYGLYMVNYDAPSPKVRIYRVNIEGRDGQLDLTEWEGQGIVRYDDRPITVRFRDMSGRKREFVSAILGRKVFLHFDDEPDYYYKGRCDASSEETRKHISDIEMTFTCQPFKRAAYPTVRNIVVEASGDETKTTTKTETIYLDAGLVRPVFSASGVEDTERPSGETIVYTRSEHRQASLYTLWTGTAGGRLKGSAHYGKPRSAYDTNTGVIIFDGLDLTGKTVTSIDLTITASRTGFGKWKEKTIKIHKPLPNVTFSETMKGEDYAGDLLGTLSGSFFENTTSYSITGTLLQNIAAWFASGGNTLVLYDPTESAARDEYSDNNCGWTDVQMDIVYEESEPSPETDHSTIEVEADGIRREYAIEEDGVIHTDDIIFRAGENRVTVNNHNVNDALTVSVTWYAEVI